MEKLFSLNKNSVVLNKNHKIIKAQDLDLYFKSEELLAKAKELADQIEQQAKIDYQKRFDDGYIQGQAEGKEEYSMKIMETVMSTLDSLQGLENQIVDVVIDSVTKIIGEIDPNERIVAIVKNALASVRGENRIIVRVCIDDEYAVKDALSAFLLSTDGSSGYIEVIGDASLRKDDCILESQMGVVEASLKSQLKILQQALRQRVGQD